MSGERTLAAIPAVVLVGGIGSRLRAVTGDLPKPMVPVGGTPFLEYLLEFLRRSGLRRVVLCLGYGADVIRSHFGDGSDHGLDLSYSIEKELRGTGGAMKLGVATYGRAQRVFALNGDSFVDVDLAEMLASHADRKAKISLAVAKVADVARFGAVEMEGSTGVIKKLDEKSRKGAGVINAGVYLVEPAVVEAIPAGVVSFEREVLPGYLGNGAHGFLARGMFIDIGVPDEYHRLAKAPEPFLDAVKGPA